MTTFQSPILTQQVQPQTKVLEAFREAISSETGIVLDDAYLDVPFFSGLGLDPLSTVEILDTVTERTGLEFPASLFRDCATLSDIAKSLGCSTKSKGFAATSSVPISTEKWPVQSGFAEVSKDIGRFTEEAGNAIFWSDVYPSQKRLVLAYVTEAFAQLGLPLQDLPPGTSASYPEGISPKHHRLLTGAIFEILQDGGLLQRQGDKFIRTKLPVDQTPSQSIFQQLVQDHSRHANTHRLLNVTGSQLADCLTGAADPIKLLFSQNKDLLQDFYTMAPGSLAASKHLAALIRRIFSPATQSGETIEILEVGAGLGGTTKFILDALVDAGIPFKYTFTDISSSFLGAARKRYQHLPPGSVEYLVLDIEKTPPEHLRGRFHAVISTNCIHATKDFVVSCTNVRRLLRPGGFFALVEFTTRLYWLDLVFGLLDGWWLFEDTRTHCTVDQGFCKASLETGGFRNSLWADGEDMEKPNPQVVIACTE